MYSLLLSFSITHNEKPVLCELPYLQLGFFNDVYPHGFYKKLLHDKSFRYFSGVIYQMGDRLLPSPGAFFGRN